MNSGFSSEELEALVIGCILIECDQAVQYSLVEQIEPECFGDPNLSKICLAMKSLAAHNEPIDIVAVRQVAKIDLSRLIKITDDCATPANARHYVSLLRDSCRRAVLSQRLAQANHDALSGEVRAGDIIASTAATLDELAGFESVETEPLSAVVRRVYSEFERRQQAGGGLVGLSCGFADLDKATSGFRPGDVTVIAARPSMGKTALALGMARSIAQSGHKCLFVSLEMSSDSLAQRLIAGRGGISLQRFASGSVSPQECGDLVRALDEIYRLDLCVVDRGVSFASDLSQLLAGNRFKICFVDYLQLLSGKGETREREVAGISRELKRLAMRHKIPIVVLSQLNRSLESRSDKRPQLSDLRESGAIEQDADVICFVYRDEYYNPDTEQKGVAELIIGKQRNGPTGTIKLKWISETASFWDCSTREVKP